MCVCLSLSQSVSVCASKCSHPCASVSPLPPPPTDSARISGCSSTPNTTGLPKVWRQGGGVVLPVCTAHAVCLCPCAWALHCLPRRQLLTLTFVTCCSLPPPPPTFPIAVAYVPSAEKQRVEQLQRDARAKRSADNTAYAPKFFKYCRVPIQRPHKVAL